MEQSIIYTPPPRALPYWSGRGRIVLVLYNRTATTHDGRTVGVPFVHRYETMRHVRHALDVSARRMKRSRSKYLRMEKEV